MNLETRSFKTGKQLKDFLSRHGYKTYCSTMANVIFEILEEDENEPYVVKFIQVGTEEQLARYSRIESKRKIF